MQPHVKEFIDKVFPFAVEVEEAYGVPILVTIGQAAIESGWGKASIANNYFGFKWDGTGKYRESVTTEWLNGNYVTITDKFQAFDTPLEGFMHYGRKLATLPFYRKAFEFKNHPETFIYWIHKGGYATDPNYASKVTVTMRSITPYVEELLQKKSIQESLT